MLTRASTHISSGYSLVYHRPGLGECQAREDSSTFPVIVRAAPHGRADVVVQQHYQLGLRQRLVVEERPSVEAGAAHLHRLVEDLHGGEAHQGGVGRESGGVDDGVEVEVVQGEHEADTVEAELLDLVGDEVDRLAVETVHYQVFHVGSVPGKQEREKEQDQ